ncbi:hypothetical protein [Richelia sinica]|uniref:hypothetical protein n=1 Tax=Richelia sinica TaxID=1357545 RepID=UPI0016880B8D|nr:hypothetical protein [Richelia sinica]MBD2665685.1 hypothetical protein [Richelia sinica FACHB-800]
MKSLMGKLVDYFVDDVFYQAESACTISQVAQKAVAILDAVPSISPCHDRDFKWSRPIFTLNDSTVVKTCKNVIGLHHIFLADNHGKLIYGGFVIWSHSEQLQAAIRQIKKDLT